MFTYLRDPGADGVGVAFTSAALDLGDASPTRAVDAAALAAALGVPVAVTRQVHGRAVTRVRAADAAGSALLVVPGAADALVTTDRGVALAVRVADCVPVLLADARVGAVAAVHAGRAGLLAGVLDAALDELAGLGASDVEAWIGPHICGACYEVPPELAADAAARLGVSVPATRWGTVGVDQTAAAQAHLAARGVRIHTEALACTYERPDLHSHRRDGEASGRQVGLVWLAG